MFGRIRIHSAMSARAVARRAARGRIRTSCATRATFPLRTRVVGFVRVSGAR